MNGDLYITGTASWLPPSVPISEALAAGECGDKLAASTAALGVATADKEHPAEMAARASRAALERAGTPPEQVALILYASLYSQGHQLWAPASYVQRVAVGNHCPAMEIRQVSNGGMAALEIASSYLAADRARHSVLITTGDRMNLPGFDRWRSDPGTVYADGGTAAVVSRAAGFAKILSMAMTSDAELEGMHRGGEPFGTPGLEALPTVDLELHKRDFVAEFGLAPTTSRVRAGQQAAVDRALERAGVEISDIRRFVLPHVGLRRLDASFCAPLGVSSELSTWEWSRSVGHLGAGDSFASLDYLVDSGALAPGDLCLLLGVGAGFTWSCAVVEIADQP